MSKKKVMTIEERDRTAHDGVKMRGFYRLQIEDGPTGEIVGDSGWCQNTVTNLGKLHYIVRHIELLPISDLYNLCQSEPYRQIINRSEGGRSSGN